MSVLGVLAFAAGALATLGGAASVAARLFAPPRSAFDRATAAIALAFVMCVVEVRALSLVKGLVSAVMIPCALIAGIALVAACGAEARAIVAADVRRAVGAIVAAFAGGAWSVAAWVGAGALAIAGLAAYLLPPWAWDALGYHLPIVEDAVQTHWLRWVPTNVPYVNVYPRAVETFFVWCRLHLLDGALLDFCQAPFAALAVVATAATAYRSGASAPRALALGMLFCAVPVVSLQLATSYVDVAYAALLVTSVYFATGPLERRDLLLWALSTAFFLASKPCAPTATAIVSLVVFARAVKQRRALDAVVAVAIVFVLGAEKYVENVIAHGNPIWPIELDIGPIRLPGTDRAADLFVQGLPEPYAHYGWARRVLASLFADPARYIYDMRMGGFGPLFALGVVPLCVIGARRARAAWLPAAVVVGCALATPAAHWLRYTLALPAGLLALAIAATEAWKRAPRAIVEVGLAGLGVLGLTRAVPAFTEGGPSLLAVLAMPPSARGSVVGVDGHESLWVDARARLRPGEAIAYDRTFSLPGLLWRADGGARVVFVDESDPARVTSILHDEHARIVVAGDAEPAGAAVAADRERYKLLFRCPMDPCTVYEAQEPPPLKVAR